jgi:hypothetical protein
MYALPSLETHLLTTRFHTASSLEEGTRGSSGDMISYSQVAGREEEMILFQVKNRDNIFARPINRFENRWRSRAAGDGIKKRP